MRRPIRTAPSTAAVLTGLREEQAPCRRQGPADRSQRRRDRDLRVALLPESRTREGLRRGERRTIS